MKTASADKPWLAQEVIDWLYSILQWTWTVVETGAGGTTHFLRARVLHVRTYEHDPIWARRVGVKSSPYYPTVGLQGLPREIDLALIDGRGRVRSVIDVLPHIKPGGWLVLDDSDRPRYEEARRVADAACSVRIVFRNGTDETTAWRKD